MSEAVTAIQLLRKREACERLGISERQLELFIAQGRLRVHRLGRRCVRIDERELARFVRDEGREQRSLKSGV
jgi:excisionase family DNA binding protein